MPSLFLPSPKEKAYLLAVDEEQTIKQIIFALD